MAAGVYNPTADEKDREASFHLKNGVAIYGGFPAGGGDWEDRDWETYETILSGDINNTGDLVGNSYHVVTGSGTDETSVPDGFIITAGNSNGDFEDDNFDLEVCFPQCGAGLYNIGGNPLLSNLIFTENSAQQ